MYVIIVGGGKVGAYLANLLSSGGERVIVSRNSTPSASNFSSNW